MMEISWIQKVLINWYTLNGRDFPWRQDCSVDPYKILVTEVLLQKTRAEAVAAIWEKFFEAFPKVTDLSSTSPDQVLRVIKELGLAKRAKRLIEMSRQIVQDFNGLIPSKFDELLRLKGVGPYVASAVLCFGFHKAHPIVDVNVMRLINRFKGYTDERSARVFIQEIIPTENPHEFNWALLDLGALVCTFDNPSHIVCPLDPICPKTPLQVSRWRFLRKHVGKKVRLSLQPYSMKRSTN